MDIKKIESNRNNFILFLNEKELTLIERILLERVARARYTHNYNPALNEYTATETYTACILQDEIWDELYK